jgi:hypothetical protein
VTNRPTARTHLAAGWLIELVWCKACHHQAAADLQAIIDAGQGDRPLKDLKFRFTKCSSSLTTKPLGEHRGAEGQKLQITPIQAQVAVVGLSFGR